MSYSSKDLLTPAVQMLFMAASLTVVMPLAADWRGAWGVGLAYTLAQWVAAFALLAYLTSRFRMLDVQIALRFAWRYGISSAFAVAAMVGAHHYLLGAQASSLLGYLLDIFAVALSGGAALFATAWLLKIEELSEVHRFVRLEVNKFWTFVVGVRR